MRKFRKETRYDYLYTPEELHPYAIRLKSILEVRHKLPCRGPRLRDRGIPYSHDNRSSLSGSGHGCRISIDRVFQAGHIDRRVKTRRIVQHRVIQSVETRQKIRIRQTGHVLKHEDTET